MRDLLVLALGYGSLPLVFLRPFYGIVVYSWIAYMRPHDLAWGLSGSRMSMAVALTTIAGLVVAVGRERFFTIRAQSILMVVFLIWTGLAANLALDPTLSRARMILMAKVIIISLLTTGLVITRDRYRILTTVMAFSLGLLGLKYALFGILRGGARIVSGPGGFMIDNNDLAVALAMGLPLLWGVALVETRPVLRISAQILFGASIIAVIFTFSRTGFLAVSVVSGLLFLRSGRKLGIIAVALLTIVLLMYTSSGGFKDEYASRVGSITEFEQDESAMGRIEAWKRDLAIARDYPVFGIGPDNLRLYYRTYTPAGGNYRVSHNTYLQVLIESGMPGLALFIALFVLTVVRLQRLRSKRFPDWVRASASMLQICLAAYAVGALFLDRAYFDLAYHLVALSVGLEVAAASTATSDVVEEEVERSPTAWWLQDRRQVYGARLETGTSERRGPQAMS